MSNTEPSLTADHFIAAQAGTKTDPAIRFAADPRTGLRLKGSGVVALVANGGDVLAVSGPAGTVNGLDVLGAAAGTPVVLAATGRDTDVSLMLRPQGNGVLRVDAAGYAGRLSHPNDIPTKKYVDDRVSTLTAITALRTPDDRILLAGDAVPDGVNHLRVAPAVAGQPPVLTAAGPDEIIGLVLSGQGGGSVQAPAGYTMEDGPAEAFVTKGYADARFGPAGLVFRSLTGADGRASEPLLFAPDPTRSSLLSVEATSVIFTNGTVAPGYWLGLGDLLHQDAGWVVPYDATVVRAAVHAASVTDGPLEFSVWVDDAETPAVVTLEGTGRPAAFHTAINLEIPAGCRLRVACRGGSGRASIVEATLWVKWRSVE